VPRFARDRADLVRQSPSTAAKPKPVPATSPHAALLRAYRAAGNRAVAGLLTTPAVQRAVGWSDAVTAGEAWNAGEKLVGGVRRIPLEGLVEGMQTDKAKRWKKDETKKGGGYHYDESTELGALSPEKAKGKAIVLVPAALDATQKIEVVVFLHGWTEGTHRPYAGWRTLVMAPAKPKAGKKTPDEELLERLRQGRDAKDVAPVRDVALDEVAQQLGESKSSQTVIVLPQGGLHSQFGKAGFTTFDTDAYVKEIVARLLTEGVWKDGKGKVATQAPTVERVTMSGHSGAGATLSSLAKSSKITGDLVLYDAINLGEVWPIVGWTKKRLNEALAVVKDTGKTDDEKRAYLRNMQKLRGYYSSIYADDYKPLVDALDAWFRANKKALGGFEAALRANFVVKPVALTHEELMRGVKAGTARGQGQGNILDALQALRR
jgi:hypothetical protein